MNDQLLLEEMSRLAVLGGAAIMRIYETDFAVEEKSDGSPVTLADQHCEAIILDGLRAFAPDIPFLAEENASDADIEAIGKTLGSEFFLIDPLDGTREFANRTGEFTVNIALCRDGAPVLGVVFAPVIGKLYTGQVGVGATLCDVSQTPTQIRTIQTRPAPSDGLMAVASRSHRSPQTDALLGTMNVKDFVAAGSSLKFCLIAEGKADVYPRLGRTMEWDTAAGQAVLVAAGGSVLVHESEEPLCYGKAERGFDNPYFVAHGTR